MGKSSKKSNPEVVEATPAAVPSAKKVKKKVATKVSKERLKKQKIDEKVSLKRRKRSDDEHVVSTKKQAVAGKNSSVKAAVPVKKAKQASNSSDGSNSSDSDEEPKSKMAVPAKNTPVPVAEGIICSDCWSPSHGDLFQEEETPGKGVPQAKKVSAVASKKTESSDSSSEEDEETPAKVAPRARKALVAPKKTESSDSSSDECDDEPKRKKVQALPITPSTPQVGTSGCTTLFYCKLSLSIQRSDVEEFFKDVGKVVDVRFGTNQNGSLRAFAHVDFASEADAQKAAGLNGQDFLGRVVKLESAVYTPQTGNDENFNKGPTIFVRGFNSTLGFRKIQVTLELLFGRFGMVSNVTIPRDDDSGVLEGHAYVRFKYRDDMLKALVLDGSTLLGFPLTVVELKPIGDASGGKGDGGRGGRFGDSGGRRGGGGMG